MHLGDTASDIDSLFSSIGSTAVTASAVLQDPAFSTVLGQLQTIEGLNPSPGGGAQGVGLSQAVPVLNAYIWYLRYPYGPVLIAGGAMLLLVALGHKMGRRGCPARSAPAMTKT